MLWMGSVKNKTVNYTGCHLDTLTVVTLKESKKNVNVYLRM